MTVPQSKLKVDSISSIDGGEIVVSYGATIPSGAQFTVEGDVSFAGIVTATSFSGDGSDLTGVGGVPSSVSKLYAIRTILDPTPYRS